MAHIPKRATQHGIFMSGNEVSPPALKPGQNELHRQDLYSAEAKPVKEPYLFQDQFNDSHYVTSTGRATLPEDYEDPAKSYKPPEVTCAAVAGGTQHWKSEYRAALTEGKSEETEFGRPWFPSDKYGEPESVLTRGEVKSTYHEEFGKHGSDPRDKILDNQARHTVKKPMDAGTTKGTNHIPGYQGFVPSNCFNAEVARVEKGDFNRSVDKTNIDEIFHTNLVGYTGHAPASALNDRGGRQPTGRTTGGHDFQDPATRFASLKDP